ncbi:MAG TPA: glycosyl hydrolase [Polyangia bacterium]|nr:glycosyl hydrolase [Polyangia bacterium]
MKRATVVTAWALFAVCGCGPRGDHGAADLGAGTGGDGTDGADAAAGGDGAGDLGSAPLDLTAGAPPSAKTPPTSGALFGAFVGVGNNDTPDFLSEEQLLGRRWVIDNRFYSYEDFVADRTAWDVAEKTLPLITWEPHWPLDDIIAGTYDDIFHMRAQGLRDLGVDILLRWGHEMNGNWYPWAGANNGGASGGPAKYIAAYHHVHDLFVADGATNVYWVWCPLVADVPAESWNHWTNYYPGDDYVDWVGLDAYNWGNSSSCCTWQSFGDLVTDLYGDYAGKKPLILAETASAEVGGNKAAWIDDMHAQLKTTFTGIKAVVWFDINKETDWRIDSSPTALAAYQAMALDPYFNP